MVAEMRLSAFTVADDRVSVPMGRPADVPVPPVSIDVQAVCPKHRIAMSANLAAHRCAVVIVLIIVLNSRPHLQIRRAI